MELGRFYNLIQPLKAFYGITNIPIEKLDYIHKQVKHLSDEEFFHLIEIVMSDYRNFPTPGEFRELSRIVDRRSRQTLELEAKIALEAKYGACRGCLGTGLLYAKSKGDISYEYVFRCKCEAPDDPELQISKSYPRWNDSYKAEYEVIFR